MSSTGKRKREHVDWAVTLASPHIFRSILQFLEKTVEHVTFHVCVGDDFTGLRMDAINGSKVCMVKIAYESEIACDDPSVARWFCTRTATLKVLLKTVKPDSVVTLSRKSSGDVLVVEIRENTNGVATSRVPLIESDNQLGIIDMDSIQFSRVIDIKSEVLKDACKVLTSIEASFVDFKILETEGSSPKCFFSISGEGTMATTERTYQGILCESMVNIASEGAEDEDGEDGEDEGVETYAGRFPQLYVSNVLSSFDRSNIQLFLQEGMPLVMQYNLGGENNYIKIVVAPSEV